MWKICLAGFLISMTAGLSAQPNSPRHVEQGRSLQTFHAEGRTNRECCGGNGSCGLGLHAGLGRCGPQVGASLCPLNVNVGLGCCDSSSCEASSCKTSGCGTSSCGSCCSPCRAPLRPQRSSCRPVRPYYGYTCCNTPIYDDSDKEDIYMPEQNAYWPTKRRDSWMRELQW